MLNQVSLTWSLRCWHCRWGCAQWPSQRLRPSTETCCCALASQRTRDSWPSQNSSPSCTPRTAAVRVRRSACRCWSWASPEWSTCTERHLDKICEETWVIFCNCFDLQEVYFDRQTEIDVVVVVVAAAAIICENQLEIYGASVESMK